MKGLTLNGEGRESFLYRLYDDLSTALRKLMRVAEGDYGSDKYARRFPKFEAADGAETPRQLFGQVDRRQKPCTEHSRNLELRDRCDDCALRRT